MVIRVEEVDMAQWLGKLSRVKKSCGMVIRVEGVDTVLWKSGMEVRVWEVDRRGGGKTDKEAEGSTRWTESSWPA